MKTYFSLQTFGKNAVPDSSKSVGGGKIIGMKLAEELKKREICKVVFDRNGLPYKGILVSIADALRTSGILV
jgi:ribosomal protein L18